VIALHTLHTPSLSAAAACSQARGRDLGKGQVIQHRERFNDLKPFVWSGAVSSEAYKQAVEEHEALAATAAAVSADADEDDAADMLADVGALRRGLNLNVAEQRTFDERGAASELLIPINPVGSLNLEVFMTQLMEGDAAATVASAGADGEKKSLNVGVEKGAELLPEDCPPFYEELRATIASVPVLCGNAEMQEALVRLEPDRYFPNGVRITKSAAQKYGRELMELFSLMCKAHRKSAAKVRRCASLSVLCPCRCACVSDHSPCAFLCLCR
jgi:hypothetical protein